MSDNARLTELVDTAYNSAGRSSEQFAKYQDTVTMKLKKLQNTWEQLQQRFLKSDYLKDALDIANNFVDSLSKVSGEKLVFFTMIGITLGKSAAESFLENLKSSTSKIKEITKDFFPNYRSGIKESFGNAKENIRGHLNKRNFDRYLSENTILAKTNLSRMSSDAQLATINKLGAAIGNYNNSLQMELPSVDNDTKSELRGLYGNKTPAYRLALEKEQIKLRQEEIKNRKKLVEQLLKDIGITEKLDDEKLKEIQQYINSNPAATSAGALPNQRKPIFLTEHVKEAGKNINWKGLGSVTSSSATSALAAGAMVKMGGGDTKTAIKTASLSFLAQIVPSLLAEFLPVIMAAVATIPGMIITAIAGIAIAIHLHKKKIEEAKQAEIKRLSEIKQKNEDLQKQQKQYYDSLKNAVKESEKFEEAIKNIQQLQDKSFLTSKEETTLASAKDYLNENYEGVLEESIDGKLDIITEKLEEIRKNTEKDEVVNKQKIVGNYYEEQANIGSRIDNINKLKNEYGKVKEYYETNEPDLINFAAIVKDIGSIYGSEINYNKFTNEEVELIKKAFSGDEQVFQNKESYDIIDSLIPQIFGQLRKNTIVLQEESKNTLKNIELQEKGYEENLSKIIGYKTSANTGFNSNVPIGIKEEQEKIKKEADNLEKADRKFSKRQTIENEKNFGNAFFTLAQDKKDYVQSFKNGIRDSDLKDVLARYGMTSASEMFGTEYLKSLSAIKNNDDYKALYEAAIVSAGYTTKNWEDKRKDTNAQIQVLDKLMELMFLDADSLTADVDPEIEKRSKDFEAALNNTSQSYLDYITGIEKYVKENEDYLKNEENYYTKAKEAAGFLQEKQITDNVNNIDVLGVISFANQLKGLSLDDSQYERIGSLVQNLPKNALGILGNLNLENLSSMGLDEQLDYINRLGKAIGDMSGAKDIFYDYVEGIRAVTEAPITTSEAVQVLKEGYETQLDEIYDKWTLIADAELEMAKNGEIAESTYKKLVKEGFRDYVNIGVNGYELLTDKANEYHRLLSEMPLNDIRSKIKTQETDINIKKEKLRQSRATYEKYGDFERIAELEKEIEIEEERLLELRQLSTEEAKKFLIHMKAYYHELLAQQDEANEKLKDEKENRENILKQIKEANEALDEANKKAYEARHGTDTYRTSLDGLLNYDNELKQINKDLEENEYLLSKINFQEEANALMAQKRSEQEQKYVYTSAKQLALQERMANQRAALESKFGNFVEFDSNGKATISSYDLTNLDANDEMRKQFDTILQTYNSDYENYLDNKLELMKYDEQIEEERINRLKEYTNIQSEIINVLKQNSKEEIDETKKKYDALTQADNDYLSALSDAIAKQKKLRDQEKQYEDLATKEKKLSLLRRDTSGANQKEVMSLEKEVQNDRENLLNTEIDNVIDSMKELYEKQKEARDAEIEYMQDVTENTEYFAEWAANIMKTWGSSEDMASWFLENDLNAKDLTVEQKETYINDIEKKWPTILQHYAEGQQKTAQQLEQQIQNVHNTVVTDIDALGTDLLNLTEQKVNETITEADKAVESAKEKLDDLNQNLEKSDEKIVDLEKDVSNAVSSIASATKDAFAIMEQYSNEYLTSVALDSMKWAIEVSGIDTSNMEEMGQFASEHKLINRYGTMNSNFDYLLKNAYNYSEEEVKRLKDSLTDFETFYYVYTKPSSSGSYNFLQSFKSKEEAYKYAKEQGGMVREKKFATGGLVDYTGPAWVDGTKSKPEAFLSAEDTARIGAAAKILASLPFLSSPATGNINSQSIGDTTIEINLNIDGINSDYDVERMVDKIKNEIADATKKPGNSVIIRK